jgi:hypothetical protein
VIPVRKALWTHALAACIACSCTWLYFQFSTPRFWERRLDIKPVTLSTLTEKNVYWSRDMKLVRFVMQRGDKCFYVVNEDFSFGEVAADRMWYDKLILFCPDKGVGWVQNSW